MKRKWVYDKRKTKKEYLGADAGASMPVISPEVVYTKEPAWVEPGEKPNILLSVPWWIWALGVFMFFIDDEGG